MYRKAFIDLYLNKYFEFDEAKAEVDFVLDSLFNYSHKDFILGKTLENWQIDKLNKIFTERVSTHKPIQQIIGMSYFYGRKFFTDEYTLVPRPETEILVKTVLELTENIDNPEILDIGTGTGCIPLTLILENNKIKADSVDISSEAVETGRKNALFHNVLTNINFYKSDLFENVEKQYDIIVSNPPYIPLKDKDNLQIEVRDFDPATALYTNDDLGVEYYEKIIKQSNNYLKDNGYIAFELGKGQADIISNIFKDNGYSIVNITKDLNDIDRVIIAQKKF